MFVYLYVQEIFTNLHNSLLIVLKSEEWDSKSLKMGRRGQTMYHKFLKNQIKILLKIKL